MANPPSLTPEQRQQRARKAARRAPAARRGEGQAEDRLAVARRSCSSKPTAATRAGDMLAKLKVVSVLESLPGVGKVNATRLMNGLEISDTRRLGGVGAQAARAAAARGSTTPSTARDARRKRPRASA